MDKAAAAKVFAAEKNVAWVRAAVIAFNITVYYAFLEPLVDGIPWLAAVISVVASLYAVVIVAFRPWRRFPVFLSAFYTSFTDASLITLWILATGGFQSPFYVLWYISLVAIAFRFGPVVTAVVAALYAALYVGLLAAIGELIGGDVEVLVRVGYIGLIAMIGVLIARETTRQTRGRVQMQGLAEMSRAIGGTSQMEQALEYVVDTALELTDSDRGAVYLRDEKDEVVRCAHAKALSPEYIEARTGAFRELPGYATMQGGEAIQVIDALADERTRALREAIRREGFRTYLVVPLRLGRTPLGVLTLYRDRVKAYSPQEIRLASDLGNHAVIAIENMRLFNELRESEERFRTVAETAHDAIVTMDPKGRIAYVNRAAGQLFKRPPAELHGSRFDDLLSPQDRAVFRGQLGSLKEAAEMRPVELEGLRPDGSGVPIEVSSARWVAGDKTYDTAFIRDMTDRRRAEEHRLQAMEQVKELERLKELDIFKTQFINTAAHELGTPLTPIRLQLKILEGEKGGALTEDQRRSVSILQRNIDRLINLVDDILEGARLQAHRLGIERTTVDLNRLVLEAVESFSENARAAGIHLETKLEPDLVLDADPKRVMQVLFNLLSNAMNFTPANGRITVTSERLNRMAVVRVRDTGRGLRREDIDRLFRPFSQVHDTMQSTRAGTGLGLYISRGIVELHGGRIWSESPGTGLGATFSFALPLERSSETSVVPSKAEDVEVRIRDLV